MGSVCPISRRPASRAPAFVLARPNSALFGRVPWSAVHVGGEPPGRACVGGATGPLTPAGSVSGVKPPALRPHETLRDPYGPRAPDTEALYPSVLRAPPGRHGSIGL